MNVHTARKQKGFTLTEALVSFAITASGLLVIASFQAGLFSESSYNKARTEALSLAQQKIEEFKHYTHAGEDNFIDDDGDGVMDADGTYTENAIDGQNAQFTRSWNLTTSGRAKQIDVTVSWLDAANAAQSVMLATEIAWISPRVGADQLTELSDPLVSSPVGRAVIGDGNLSDYPAEDVTSVGDEGFNGLSLYQHHDNLLLVDADDKILLTLLDACLTDDGTCKDFVKISGTVYVDTANTSQKPMDIHVIAADAAHCERWVPTGTLESPPATSGGDYLYYNYTCYLGGGWHGNIGFITATGLQQKDKVCQGDPTALDKWARPVIALRRAYRGMIQKGPADNPVYYTQGIKDAITLTGHDFVFTELLPEETEGTSCVGSDAPMTRSDSWGGMVFKNVPTDFFCLNSDDDGDSMPDYLDSFDTATYSATVYCPYDPTDPPVQSHKITGAISIVAAGTLDVSNFDVVTSDGPGNCEWVSPFDSTIGGYRAEYSCTVYDWGSGWTGSVIAKPNTNFIWCPTRNAEFSNVTSDQSLDFACSSATTVSIHGALSIAPSIDVSSILMTDLITGFEIACEIIDDASYSCLTPYYGVNWDGTVTVSSTGYVCGAASGVFTLTDLTAESSPYIKDVAVAKSAAKCP